ncbi:hypothetical protein DLAC_09815 [Tieghemostelium lacteum]|uniref:Uncharacterized protein n=1 Tax=Tieghemostelium lacteum TaxID=361077 RepID=A0A151Z7C8_TIELA|nr:hypothetical protein DLAC_09815 [Tieghemostelium lacteum]|eukprot:KYQ89838.1 hypothetical protein DLAC_09815 [Tieghemostelium lacteum]
MDEININTGIDLIPFIKSMYKNTENEKEVKYELHKKENWVFPIFKSVYQYNEFLDILRDLLAKEQLSVEIKGIQILDHMIMFSKFWNLLNSSCKFNRDLNLSGDPSFCKFDVLLANCTHRDLVIYYKNGILNHIFLNCNNIPLLGTILDLMISYKILFSSKVIYHESLLPISTLVRLIVNNNDEILSVDVTDMICNNIIKYYLTQKEVISSENIKSLVELVRILSPLDDYMPSNVSNIAKFLAINCMEKLTLDQKQSLKDTFLSLLPHVLIFRNSVDTFNETVTQYNILSEYYKCYGQELINLISVEWFWKWIRLTAPSTPNSLILAISVLDKIGYENVTENRLLVYTHLVDAIYYGFEIYKLFTVLSSIIEMIMLYPTEFTEELGDLVVDFVVMAYQKCYIPKHAGYDLIYHLLKVVMVTVPNVAVSRFGEIYKTWFKFKHDKFHCLNEIIMRIPDQFRQNLYGKYYSRLYQVTLEILNRKVYCQSIELLETILHFNREPEAIEANILPKILEIYRYQYLNDQNVKPLLKLIEMFPHREELVKFLLEALSKLDSSKVQFNTIYQILGTNSERTENFLQSISDNVNGIYRMPIDLVSPIFIHLWSDYTCGIFQIMVNEYIDNLKPAENMLRFLMAMKSKVPVQEHIKKQLNFVFTDSFSIMRVNRVDAHHITPILVSLDDFPQFYKTLLLEKDFKDLFTHVHSKIMEDHVKTIDRAIWNDLHQCFIKRCLEEHRDLRNHYNQYIFTFLGYFKCLPINSIAPDILYKLSEVYKHHDATKRKAIDDFIRKGKIQQLYFLLSDDIQLFESSLEIGQYDGQIQNHVIQNILVRLYNGKGFTTKNLLEISLVSKAFFGESQKALLRCNIPLKFNSDTFLKRSPWSLLCKGIYHLNYSDLQYFHRDVAFDTFYQLSSLTIDKTFMFLVDREMSDLQYLQITKLSTDGDPVHYPKFTLDSIHHLLKYCFNLQSFSILRVSIELQFEQFLNQIIPLILKNNPNIQNITMVRVPKFSQILNLLNQHKLCQPNFTFSYTET